MDEVDIRLRAGTFLKETLVAKAHTKLTQHAHAYAHVSVIVRGQARVYQGGEWLGDFNAPAGIRIPARISHQFVTLCDDTVILCVHDGDADLEDR